MRKLAITLGAITVTVLAGVLAWNADATTFAGSLTAVAKIYSPIEKVGCRKIDRCPYGYHRVCPEHKCGCSPCYLHGYYYGRRIFHAPGTPGD